MTLPPTFIQANKESTMLHNGMRSSIYILAKNQVAKTRD